jgi:hypothetical protein
MSDIIMIDIYSLIDLIIIPKVFIFLFTILDQLNHIYHFNDFLRKRINYQLLVNL